MSAKVFRRRFRLEQHAGKAGLQNRAGSNRFPHLGECPDLIEEGPQRAHGLMNWHGSRATENMLKSRRELGDGALVPTLLHGPKPVECAAHSASAAGLLDDEFASLTGLVLEVDSEGLYGHAASSLMPASSAAHINENS